MNQKKKAVLLTGGMFLLLLIIIACATEPMAPVTAEPTPQAEAQQTQQAQPVVEAPKPEPKPASPYDVELKPLTPADCGRCHASIFNTIKTEGGKHKIDCTKCHTQFHTYNPIKQNWNEIMPKCQTCHGLIHGQEIC